MRLTRAYLLAVAAGATLFLAHPPVGASVLAFASPALFLAAIAAATFGPRTQLRHTAGIGFTAGLVAFLALLTWLVAPAGYLAWILLAAFQAAWFALFAVAARPWLRSAWIVVVAPVLWTGMEIWRGSVPLGGFPWGELGYAHAATEWLVAFARVVGVHGLTFLTVLVGAAVFRLFAAIRRGRRPRLGQQAVPASAVIVGIIVPLVFAPAPPPVTDGAIDVLAVQGNDLYDFEGSPRDEDVLIARNMLELTRRSVADEGSPDLTVWPESSVDRDPFGSSGGHLRPFLEEAAALVDGNLLFGANLDGPDPGETFLNASVLVDAAFDVRDRYVKRHYVPFGEYVPWRSVLGGFPPLRQVPRDGVSGDGPGAITTDEFTAAVVICYETLFPEIVRSNVVSEDAGLLVASTNDASFGRSAESDQHIAQSRLRAVETGRWVVHAALSGGSALIDPDGRVLEETALFTRDTIRAHVPLARGSTPYLAIGGALGAATRWVALALSLVSAVVLWRRRQEGDLDGD